MYVEKPLGKTMDNLIQFNFPFLLQMIREDSFYQIFIDFGV